MALRILHLEDNVNDAELARLMLEAEGIKCEIKRVETEEEFTTALQEERFDLIISDFSLPGFDGNTALKFARSRFPKVPFVFVSGTIGEDAAVQSLLNG